MVAFGGCGSRDRETLENGIVLPERWPPERPLSMEPQTLPYLIAPPSVIPIDRGRQLFVDNFLIADTTLRRTFHRPRYYKGNPVLEPDRPWEQVDEGAASEGLPPSPAAMVFSDGVFWDPDAQLFRMWYMAGYTGRTCCATSTNGIDWVKPDFDVVPGTNIVVNESRDSVVVCATASSAIWPAASR